MARSRSRKVAASTSRSRGRRRRGSGPPRRAASGWRTGRCAGAASGRGASRRSSDKARWEPRLSRDEGVDLVDDDGPDGAQDLPPAVAGEQDVERLRRRHQDVRRRLRHGRALRGRRVAGAHQHAHFGQGRVERADLGQRPLQVLLHVVGERPQRRDVEDARLVGQRAPLRSSESMADRKAASVLPDPVGAAMRMLRPARISGQPSAGAPSARRAVGEPALDDGVEGGERNMGINGSDASIHGRSY